jgi:hypothetical protein
MDTPTHAPADRGQTDSGEWSLYSKGGLDARKTRKPMLLLRLSVLFLLRAEGRENTVLLFHEPPRDTRRTLPSSRL